MLTPGTISGENDGKKVVYLDSNYISAIAKVQLGQIRDERFSTIYDTLVALLEKDKVAVPYSIFHVIELEGASEIVKGKALEVLKGLSRGVCLKEWQDILDLQIIRALENFFGKAATPLSYQEAFCRTSERFPSNVPLLAARMKPLSATYSKRRKTLRERFFDKSWRPLPQETLKLFKLEREAESRTLVYDYFQRPCRREYLSSCVIDAYRLGGRNSQGAIDRYRGFDPEFRCFNEFVNSDEVGGIPFVEVVSSINAAIIAYEEARGERMGDFYDVLIVGTVLPYCDVLATDNFMKSLLVTRLGLDRKYGVQVFSKKDNEIDRFLQYLCSFHFQKLD